MTITESDEAPARKHAKVPERRPTRKAIGASASGRPTKYDWESARTNYVEGVGPVEDRRWPTLQEVGEQLGIPYQRMKERSSSQRWSDQRQQHMATIELKRREMHAIKLAKESTQFDETALNTAKLGMSMILTRMTEVARDVKAQESLRQKELEREAQGMDVDPAAFKTKIRASEMDLLSKAALQWQQLGQRAMGTDVEKHEVHIDGSVQQTINVTAELIRDDPERLAGFLEAAQRTGILNQIENNIIEGEVVEDGTETPN